MTPPIVENVEQPKRQVQMLLRALMRVMTERDDLLKKVADLQAAQQAEVER